MIGFVTWPPFFVPKCYKGGQVICENMYVIQGVKNSFGKVTSWPQLISEFWSHMSVCNVASDWPHTFLHPGCFCLAYNTTQNTM